MYQKISNEGKKRFSLCRIMLSQKKILKTLLADIKEKEIMQK